MKMFVSRRGSFTLTCLQIHRRNHLLSGVLLAFPTKTDHVHRLAADANRFEYRTSLKASDPMYTPGALRYGGMRTAAALGAPGGLLLFDTGDTGVESLCRKVYLAGALEARAGAAKQGEIVAWLVGR